MKKATHTSVLFSFLLGLVLVSCNGKDERKEMEAREEAKVGKVYNREEQGIDLENRDNQFPSSRNDNRQGTGQETGAPTDTTSVNNTTNKQPAPAK